MAKEHVLRSDKWYDATFENLNLCTEGGDTRSIVGKDSERDPRFHSYLHQGEKQELTFKFSLDSHQSLKIKILECEIPYSEPKKIYRKPYIGVVFSDDIEERFITFDTFRSYLTQSWDNSSTESKKRVLQSYFGMDYTYEKMYLRLRDMKYQSFKLIRGSLCQINDILYRNVFYITDNL